MEILRYSKYSSASLLPDARNFRAFSPVSKRYRESWLRHAELLKLSVKSELWLITGPEGSGKTSTAWGIANELKSKLGWKITTVAGENADALIIDDVSDTSKKESTTKKGKALFKFLRTVRGIYSLVLFTAPSSSDLDINIRESQIAEELRTQTNGLVIWRYPIYVEPDFSHQDIEKRQSLARAFYKEWQDT